MRRLSTSIAWTGQASCTSSANGVSNGDVRSPCKCHFKSIVLVRRAGRVMRGGVLV